MSLPLKTKLPLRHEQDEDPLFQDEEETISACEAMLSAGGNTIPAERYAELLHRYKKLLSQTKKIMRISDIVQSELSVLTEKWERLSITDPLTGINNRRIFDEMLDKEYARAKRKSEPISVILVDLDHFKLFNDTYGHLAGDKCLTMTASAIKGALRRPGDILARYGGEEFGAVLPETDLPGALKVAERMRAAVEALAIPHAASPVAPVVTLSLGVGCSSKPGELDQHTLAGWADKALYDAKRGGRNRVAGHQAN